MIFNGFWSMVRSERSESRRDARRCQHSLTAAAGTYPGRVSKGKKMAGHYGATQVTTVGLRLAKLDAEKNLLFVQGSVPGHRQGLVRVRVSAR